MIRINNLLLSPNYKEDELIKKIVKELNCKKDEIVSYELFKLSIDARKKSDVHFLATVDVKVKNENSTLKRTKSKKVSESKIYKYEQPICKNNSSNTVVVGAGPAGLFASLILARSGAKVTLIERGMDIDTGQVMLIHFGMVAS